MERFGGLTSKAYDVRVASGEEYRVVVTGLKFVSYFLNGRIAAQGGRDRPCKASFACGFRSDDACPAWD